MSEETNIARCLIVTQATTDVFDDGGSAREMGIACEQDDEIAKSEAWICLLFLQIEGDNE